MRARARSVNSVEPRTEGIDYARYSGKRPTRALETPEKTLIVGKEMDVDMDEVSPSGAGHLARCRRCYTMYDEAEQSPCHYHSGKFLGGNSVGFIHGPHGPIGWTCCGATEARALGCKQRPSHLRCEATERALATFAGEQDPTVTVDAATGGLRQRKGQNESCGPGTVAGKAPPPGVHPDAVEYEVCMADTVASVCLRHGMRRDQLMRWNRLLTTSLYPGQKLVCALAPPIALDCA